MLPFTFAREMRWSLKLECCMMAQRDYYHCLLHCQNLVSFQRGKLEAHVIVGDIS